MGEIHELFVLALSLVWFAGATPESNDCVSNGKVCLPASRFRVSSCTMHALGRAALTLFTLLFANWRVSHELHEEVRRATALLRICSLSLGGPSGCHPSKNNPEGPRH